MFPYLFDWVIAGHHFRPPTYGVLLALGFSFGYFEAIRRCMKLEEDPKHIENLFLTVVVGSILGSRLFHVVFEEPAYYLKNPSKISAVWEGGYTFYGALLLSLAFIYIYARKKKLNFLQFADIGTPSTLIGLFIGRIGCFAAGCCWGIPTNVSWGVMFKNPEAFTDIHTTVVHPTQLYESLAGLSLLFYTEWLFGRRRYPGQVFFHALIGYAASRFLIEFYRGDAYRGFIFGGALSYSQFISVIIIPFALIGMFVYSRMKEDV